MEFVILMGLQGSGKTTFFRTWFADTYAYVSKDLLRNNRRPARRQQQLVEEALQAGCSVVVDNTNPTKQDREALIELAHCYGAQVAGYYFETQLGKSLERNRQRSSKERVPDVAIFATLKKLAPPTYEEGFDRLFCVRTEENFRFEVGECVEKDDPPSS